MQESFKQQEVDHNNRDILNIFARLTTKKKKMTECDKIQLSYFIHNQSDKTQSKLFFFIILIIAEAYYCTKNGKVKGNLSLTEHLILFDPVKCSENDSFVNCRRIDYFLIREISRSTKASSTYKMYYLCKRSEQKVKHNSLLRTQNSSSTINTHTSSRSTSLLWMGWNSPSINWMLHLQTITPQSVIYPILNSKKRKKKKRNGHCSQARMYKGKLQS